MGDLGQGKKGEERVKGERREEGSGVVGGGGGGGKAQV